MEQIVKSNKELPKELIFVVAHPNHFPEKGFELARILSQAHDKEIAFLGLLTGQSPEAATYETKFKEWSNTNQEQVNKRIEYVVIHEEELSDFIEENEGGVLIFEQCQEKPFNKPKTLLKMCRELRIPYYIVQSNHKIEINRVLVPVGFLVEEKEKGIFCSGMGRFLKAEILLMPANDYGSRARNNTESIKTLLEKFGINHQIIEAKKDSFKVEIEAAKKATEMNADMILISSSRDYGIDDILFGPKELTVIKKSPVPVMIINPRKDLYTLCG